MIAILVPFFLAAQLGDLGKPGASREATYRFCVNSTAVPAASHRPEHDRATRFDMSAKLKCRFRPRASLLCRIVDSQAVSFSSATLDPTVPGVPLPDTAQNHAEYQISEGSFEIAFTPSGVGKIIVGRDVSPADLNLVRAVVNQLNVGANIAERRQLEFRHMERSVIGKCDTHYKIVKDLSGVTHTDTLRKGSYFANCTSNCRSNEPAEDSGEYKLSGLESLGRRRGESLRLEKWRNVNKCSLRADFFFGSRESLLMTEPTDYEARIVASESSIYVSDTNFASYTFNELRIDRERGEDLLIYESYSLTLATIERTRRSPPIAVHEPVSASIYAYQYVDEDEEESAEMAAQLAAKPNAA